MYAIRSYYGTVSEIIEEAIKFRELGVKQILFDPAVESLEDVITSYSIHYTKLYDPNFYIF